MFLPDRQWVVLGLLAAAVLACHGLLLVNPVLLTDDWVYSEWIANREWRTLHGVHVYAGDFLLERYFRVFAYLGDPLVTFRIASFAYIVLATWATFLICLEVGHLSRREAALIALLSAVYPGYMLHTSLTLSAYQFCYLLFLLGVLLALRSEGAPSIRHAAMRAGALVLLYLSFAANSLLVFYAGFVVVHFMQLKELKQLDWRRMPGHYASRRADYLLVPLVFWAGRTAFRFFHETNPEYNAFRLAPASMAHGFLSYAATMLPQLGRVLGSPLLYLALVPCVLFALRRRPVWASQHEPAARNCAILFFGVFLLICGILPYVVVGKWPNGDLDHWETRTFLLVGLPVAIIIVGTSNLLIDRLGVARRFAHAFLLAIIVSCCGVHVRHYVKFHSYSVEYQSLLLNLAANENARGYSVFGLISKLDSLAVTHIMYTWPYYFRKTLGGGLDRTAIIEPTGDVNLARRSRFTEQQIRAVTTDWWGRLYGFEVPLDGRQAVLIVEGGPVRKELGRTKLVLRYLYLKYAQPELLKGFLADVTRVTVLPKTP